MEYFIVKKLSKTLKTKKCYMIKKKQFFAKNVLQKLRASKQFREPIRQNTNVRPHLLLLHWVIIKMVSTFEKHGSVIGTTKNSRLTSQKMRRGQKSVRNDDCAKPYIIAKKSHIIITMFSNVDCNSAPQRSAS